MALKPHDTQARATYKIFSNWYEDAMHPNLRLVAERIGISYGTLKNFNSGMNTSQKNIYLINQFLETQGYKLKENA